MDFRAALYESYVSTHIAHRKVASTKKRLPVQARIFDQHFGALLPAGRTRGADLGCGAGALVWWLGQRGFEQTFGVDFSAEQVAVAHDLGLTGVEKGDVFAFLDAHADFDVLFARDLIEHFDKDAVFRFLGMSRAALKPGGRLVLQVPNAASPYFGRVRYGDFTHEQAFTQSSITQLLAAAGFTDIRVLPWRPAISGVRSLIRYVLWRIIEPLLKLPLIIETGQRDVVTMNLIAAATRPA